MRTLALTLVFSFIVVCPYVNADIINGDFEHGNFFGWKINIPWGVDEFSPDPVPAGSAKITKTYTYWDSGSWAQENRSAIEGEHFAVLGTGDYYHIYPHYPVGSLHITAKQELYLNKGDQISGWTSFYNGDYEAQDSGFVYIQDKLGNDISNLWQDYSGNLGTVGYLEISPWVYWEWEAPISDIFTIKLGLATGGDNRFDSYALFDDIHVTPVAVPEPSTIYLICLGLIGVSGVRKFALKK